MDTGEFNERVLPLRDRIFRLAKSMLCDAAEAEDAAQDVLERLWARHSEAAECENPEAFALRAARNHCIDRLRHRRMRERRLADMARETGGYADGGAAAEARDMHGIVQRIIGRLPERQRTVLHLRDVEGCDFARIAQVTDMNEAAVRVALSRARKAVREELIKITEYGTNG